METAAPLLGEPLAVELMNTIWADRTGVHDSLAHPEDALAWLAAVAPRVDLAVGEDLTRIGPRDGAQLAQALRCLRDALRRLAAEATSDDRTAAVSPTVDVDVAVAVADLNRTAAAAPRWSALEHDEAGLHRRVIRSAKPASEAAISLIADSAVSLFAGRERDQLRACHAPGCVLYFLKQHPRREWCSAGCGNRARVARHYQRHSHGRRDDVTNEDGAC